VKVEDDGKSPSPIDLSHGLYNSLCYRTSCDWRLLTYVPDVREVWRQVVLICDRK